MCRKIFETPRPGLGMWAQGQASGSSARMVSVFESICSNMLEKK